jgi:hypothetical protein
VTAVLLALVVQAAEPVAALVGGDVYTVTQGVVRGGTVLLRGEMIAEVGLNVEVPPEATRVELAGFRVYPGWVSATGRGIGGGRGSEGGKLADSLDPFHLSMELGVACGLTSCFVDGGGPNGVVRLKVGQVDGLVWFEPGAVNLTNTWLRGGATARDEARRRFGLARDYLAARKEYEKRKAAGSLKADEKEPARPAADDEIKLLSGELRGRMEASRRPEIQRALKLVEEFPFRLTLVGVEEGWIRPEEISRAGVACVVDARSRLDPDEAAAGPSGSTIELAAILHRAGVTVALAPPQPTLGTDGLGGRNLMTLPLAAGYAIRGGLPEPAALEGITIAAARVLGIDDKVGSIEKGKQADLIVLDGDPFHYETLVQKTFVAGREVYDKNRSPFFKHVRPREIKTTAPPVKKP